MLNKIILFSIRNKFIIGVFTLALAVWGFWSAGRLPIDAVPDITNNQVQIITNSPSFATQEVEQFITMPIEQSLANLPDVEEMRSISRFGLSVITVVFDEDVDIYFARQLVSQQLNEAQELIPEGKGKPELAPVSTGLGEVYKYVLHPAEGAENKYSATELRTIQDWIIARQLYGTKGVVEVNSFGGKLKEYEVAVDPNRLRSMDISISEVFDALCENNENTGGAYIERQSNLYFIRGEGMVKSIDDIGKISIRNNPNGIPILIRDVADVRIGSAVRYGALTWNGEREAVGGIVMMLKGENSAQVVKNIKERIAVIQKSLPKDLTIEAYSDRADLVSRAIQTVEKNLIEGALIVILVLVLFLGNFRAGLIVASAIPLSMLFALGMMNLFGVSANLMSLGAIDFGLIVDSSVIIVEAVLFRLSLQSKGIRLTSKQMDEQVFLESSKMMNAAVFGEIIILIVYIPILTLTGIEGKMFRPMAQTVSFAILGALILSVTYIPMMSALVLPKIYAHKRTLSEKMIDKLHRIYEPLLVKVLNFKKTVLAVTIAVFGLSLFVFSRLGGEFIPQLQEGDFAFHCILPQGSSLSQSIETSMLASRIIKTFPEVESVVGQTGSAEIPTDPMPPEATDLIINLKPIKEWKSGLSYNELAEKMMAELEIIPGVFFEASQPIQMRFNELMTGVRQDVAVKIYGENLDSLSIAAKKINSIIQTVNGISEPQIERISGLPQIQIEYNRDRMANYNVSVKDINDVVTTAFAGKPASQVYEDERRFDLVVRLDSVYRTSIDDVRNLFVPTRSGIQVPLTQLADVRYKDGPAQISREDGKRNVVIGFNVEDRDVKSVIEEIRQKIDSNQKLLPEGYYVTYGGQFQNLEKALSRLMLVVPISLAIIFVLLFFTFRSVKQAVLIYSAIPMAAIGGIFSLYLRGMPFSISAGVGFIALFGVAVLNGIVLMSTFNQLKKEGIVDLRQRVIKATYIRMRPVLMTASVASLGFLPMAISTSAGAEVQRPLATVVIGGLITATFLTLFVVPLLYELTYSSKKEKK